MMDDTSGLQISRAEIATITVNPSAAQAVENLFALAAQTPEAVNEAAQAADDAQASADSAQTSADNAQSTANGAAASVAAVSAAQFVVLALSAALSNERVLGGSTGVTLDLTTPGQVNIVVNVVTALGYTPANKAGDTIGPSTFSGNVDIQGESRCDTLRIDVTPTASVTAATHYIPVNANGTIYYLKASATP